MRRAAALAMLALAAAPLLVARDAAAQTSATPAAQQVVVVLPFRGNATQDLLDDAEAVVHNAILTRGSRAPERSAVTAALGVSAPSDAASVAGFGRSMGATHVITGSVRPLAGQYDLTLTLYEVPSGRSTTQQANVGDASPGEAVAHMLDALFDPSAMGPAPVDPAEAQRQADEARRRQEAEQRAQAEARRREAEARARALERDHPVRRFDSGGPISVGLALHVGGLLSGTQAAPTGPISGTQPREASSLATLLRLDGGYSIRSVAGLELVAATMLMLSPTSAFGLGAGAQFTFPAASRGAIRGTAGATLGLFHGFSGAQITTAWVSLYGRAEYQFTPSFGAFAGLSLDLAPGDNGGVTTLTVALGARLHVGD